MLSVTLEKNKIMMKHRKLLLISIGFVILAALFLLFLPSKDISWVHAMKVYGCIPCVESGTDVTFVILTSDNISLAPNVTTTDRVEVVSVPDLTFPEIEDDILTISNIRCTNAMEMNGGIYWIIDATLTSNISYTKDFVEITRICYNGEEYEIGHLKILLNQAYETDSVAFSLKSNAAASVGRRLRPYHATFLNTGDSPIDSYDIVYPMYENAENQYEIDGALGASSVFPNSSLYVESDFSACDLEESDFYYVTPILTYKYKGENYSACLTPYTSGFQLSKEDVQYYIELYGK